MIEILMSVLDETVAADAPEVVTEPIGTPTGSYQYDPFTYSSSIDSITNLWAALKYDTGLTNLPIFILMHGWSEQGISYVQYLERFASYGYLACSVGMRGRDGADGSRDATGREAYDIYDCITYIKANYASIINPDAVLIVGYSGGGGNTFGFVSKFPDLCQVGVEHFGMSDYGYDGTNSWWFTDGRSVDLTAAIGPRSDLNTHRSRNAAEQIVNFMDLGFLFMFHDTEDGAVDVVLSDRVRDKYISESKSTYYYSRSTIGDPERWTHGQPSSGSDVEKSEPYWKDSIFGKEIKSVQESGTIQINGFVKTKRFEIWLGDGVDETENGKNRNAEVIYNVNTDTYNINPQYETGATQMRVIITQGAKSANQIITTQQDITVT